MEDLKQISYEDRDAEFDFSRTPLDESVTSDLLLYDYGWMHYKLISFLPTRKYGDLELCFSYFGTTTSGLYVKQTMGNKVRSHRLLIPIYLKNISPCIWKNISHNGRVNTRFLEEKL